jgi:HK97 family phage major capsid protein
LAFGAHTVTGTATTQPVGFLPNATVGVNPTGTAAGFGSQGTTGLGTDILVNLVASLPEPYASAPDAGFIMKGSTLAAVRNIKVATSGDLVGSTLVGDGSGAATPSLFGYPLYTDPTMPTFGNTNRVVAFGDWSRYFVRIVNGIRWERSDDYAFGDGLVTFRLVFRADGALIDNTAIRVFVSTT